MQRRPIRENSIVIEREQRSLNSAAGARRGSNGTEIHPKGLKGVSWRFKHKFEKSNTLEERQQES